MKRRGQQQQLSPVVLFLLLFVVASSLRRCASSSAASDEDGVTLRRAGRPLLKLLKRQTNVEAAEADEETELTSDTASNTLISRVQVKKRSRFVKPPAKNETTSSGLLSPPPVLNCTHVPRRRRRLRFLRSRRHRILSRRAYRMAILAKLAYYDFRRGYNGTDSTANSRPLQFSLVDDPHPPQYLQLSNANGLDLWRGNDETMGTKVKFQKILGGAVARLQVLLCSARAVVAGLRRSIVAGTFHTNKGRSNYAAQARRSIVGPLLNATNMGSNNSTDLNQMSINITRPHNASIKAKCRRSLFDRYEAGKRYQIEWTLQNWYEASLPKVKWHDTDLIVATSGSTELVLSFGGTASASDQLTNVQTFEPVGRGIFGSANGCAGGSGNATNNDTISGSVHRGFLNAYSRVVRGSILRLCETDVTASTVALGNRGNMCKMELTRTLHSRYDDCLALARKRRKNITNIDTLRTHESDDGGENKTTTYASNRTLDASSDNKEASNDTNTTKATKWARLKRKLANRIDAKRSQKRAKQLLGCQSDGEKLMDILRELVTDALQSGHSVYLTGHSQGAAIATLLALDIVLNSPQVPITKLHLWTFGAPEVADSAFYSSAIRSSARLDAFLNDRTRYNRFVTRAQDCGEDFVTSIASKSLNRRINRRLGGVRGNIVHAAEAVYVPFMGQKSGVQGHFMKTYLRGISIDSPEHPLAATYSDEQVRRWMGY